MSPAYDWRDLSAACDDEAASPQGYQDRATQHRPPDVTATIHDLSREGLSAHDIAAALRIGVRSVIQVRRPC
jgi:hypothetical protein